MTLTKKMTVAALFAGVAVLLGYVECLLPVVPPIAGIKLGLGNIAVLLAMRMCGSESMAAGVMLTKILVSATLFSGIGGLPYSLAGGVTSFLAMAVLCRTADTGTGPQTVEDNMTKKGRLSAAGISAAGGTMHMVAQTAVAAWMTSTQEVLLLLPFLMALGALTGLLNGVIVNMMERRMGRLVSKRTTENKV